MVALALGCPLRGLDRALGGGMMALGAAGDECGLPVVPPGCVEPGGSLLLPLVCLFFFRLWPEGTGLWALLGEAGASDGVGDVLLVFLDTHNRAPKIPFFLLARSESSISIALDELPSSGTSNALLFTPGL